MAEIIDSGSGDVIPYYFNAYMSFQMTGVTDILVGPGNPETLHPDAGLTKNLLIRNSCWKSYASQSVSNLCLSIRGEAKLAEILIKKRAPAERNKL